MRTILRKSLALVLAGAVTMGAIAISPSHSNASEALASVQAVSCPSVQLKHWKSSTRQEKLAFLFGFATVLEMEKEWQGNMPLAINNSITPTWVRGLQGRTLGELCSALDTYVAQNPDKMEDSVAGTLGRLFVAPKLTQSEKEVARAHYRQIKSNK